MGALRVGIFVVARILPLALWRMSFAGGASTALQCCSGMDFGSYRMPRSDKSLGCASLDTTRLWQTEQSFVMVTPDLLV